ncbi:chaplin [Streptomyces sp. NPDC051569]|uniref:chaplin n=1 Tax=Streptomyces sp. NPDC051569 TaxID=3365661 RepID=UPI0037BA9F93
MRDLISKGLLTAAAATSVLSMSGGYAQATEAGGVAANSPGVLSGNNVQIPVDVPVNVCGNTVDPIGVLNPAFGNVCANRSDAPRFQAPVPPAAGPYGGPATHVVPAPHSAPRPVPAPQSPDAYGSHDGHEGYGGHGTHGGHAAHQSPRDTHDEAAGSTSATGTMTGSPGVGTGNGLELPIDIPLNLCGDSVDLIGILNPVFGNGCANNAPVPVPAPPVSPAPPAHPAPPVAPPTDGRAIPPHTPARPPVQPVPVHLPQAPDPVAQLAHTGSDPNLLAAAAMSAGLLIGGGILYRRSRSAAPARV